MRLPEELYDHLEICPEKMMKELTPERYRQAVSHYLDSAKQEGNRGGVNLVISLCDRARCCAEKGFEVGDLQPVLETIQEVGEASLSTAKSIERDREIASRFSWRIPNSRESWLVAELGYDPFPQPTSKDYAEISAAERRLQNRGL